MKPGDGTDLLGDGREFAEVKMPAPLVEWRAVGGIDLNQWDLGTLFLELL